MGEKFLQQLTMGMALIDPEVSNAVKQTIGIGS